MKKYPRTPHLPWSPGATSDDVWIESLDSLKSGPIVITEKMDGECTTLYRDGLHARSIDARSHPSQSWVRGLHASICSDIPIGWRVCGENLYARHSISYTSLPSFFLVFAIFDGGDNCLSWDTTEEWCRLLGLETVPVIYRGEWDDVAVSRTPPKGSEGYVVRKAKNFKESDFALSVAKYVRANHVQTSTHWKSSEIIPNELKEPCDKVSE